MKLVNPWMSVAWRRTISLPYRYPCALRTRNPYSCRQFVEYLRILRLRRFGISLGRDNDSRLREYVLCREQPGPQRGT